jgi:cysteine-rich repeat protein
MKMKALLRSIGRLMVATPLVLASCGSDSGSSEDVGEVQLPLPAGSNAQVVSTTVPSAMAPGERIFVTTVMRNTGASSPANDWNSTYFLSRVSTVWNWVSTPVAGTVTPGNNATFGYVITAPTTPGTYPYTARMRQDIQFGQTVSVPNVVVSTATTPQWDCTMVSNTIPATMTPGESRSVSITVQNTGAQTWGASGFFLKTQDTPPGLWGNTANALTVAVAPGATRAFSLALKAPSTPGTYTLKREMLDSNSGGIGFFSLVDPCVNVSITVGGAAALNASIVSQDFPTLMAPGESRVVTAVMNNTGTQTWTGDGSFGLYSRNTPTSLWGITQDILNVATAPGANATFQMVISAPSTPGNYNHVWQMRKTTGADAAFFGATINVAVVVDANAPAQYNAAVTNQNIPLRITAGKNAIFDITMQNTGSGSWTGTPFALVSTNTPSALWTLTTSPLGAAETVAAGASRQFLLNVKAPATPGTYSSSWRMRYAPGGVGFFGATALTTSIEVTLCGNGVVDAGETCDDNNLVDGDGCSEVCQTETTVTVDLASQAAGRTITGTQSNRQLSTVAIGDVTNDGTPDVVVGENATVLGRNQAGAVYGFSGGGFLSGATTSASTGFAFRIYGANDLDGFGTLSNGSIVIGDVTGDSLPDLIVGAPGADGAGNLRSNAGEVYVFSGAGGLTGTIDLAAAPAQLTATLIGPHVDDALRVLAVGDLTGDGIGDLVLGASDDTNGLGSGAIHVVVGGAGLTGTIDLLAPAVTVHTILGAAASDVLGTGAAIGDFGGTADNDLVFGASNATPSGRSQAGVAYAIFGPLTGNRSMANAVGSATGPDVAWIGAGANDHLGGAVAAGNVGGTARADVVIGAIQQRKGGLQFGAANVYAGPLVSGTTYDLNGAGGQTAIILGVDQYDNLGGAIRLADWSGDGVLDIAVSAHAADGPLNDRDRTGELTIIRGGAGITGTIDLAAYSPLFIAYAGTDVDLMGNRATTLAFGRIDADGRADVCVGSQRGTTLTGRVDCFQAQ